MSDNLVMEDFMNRVLALSTHLDDLPDKEGEFIRDMLRSMRARVDAREMGIQNVWSPSAKQMNYVQSIYEEWG